MFRVHGHLFCFGACKSHLDCLDALQHQAASICHCTFPSLESCQHAAAIGLKCQLLDGVGLHFAVLYIFPNVLIMLPGDHLAWLIHLILPGHLNCNL